ncbi:MAG: hypothetical protein RI564_09855, partial [Gracilimonas sp.]|nr:hypothetical protein [Gracilimonas sp.]
LKEINAPSLGLQGSHQSCGIISFLTLHYATFFTLFSLRPNWKTTDDWLCSGHSRADEDLIVAIDPTVDS